MASGLKEVDLDKLLEEFVVFQKYTHDGHNQAELLEEQLESVNKQAVAGQEREKQLHQELEKQQGLVSQLQGILTKRCDMEDENRALQKELEEMKSTQKAMQETHKEKVTELETTMEDQHTAHQVELVELKEMLKQNAQEEQAKFNQILQTKEHQTEQLHQQITEEGQNHQTELSRLRQEYENKLLKLQKQTSKQQASQGSAANQDIFRKKLQHAKVQSEREISGLKRTIGQLQQQLAAANQQQQQQQKPMFNTVLHRRGRRQ